MIRWHSFTTTYDWHPIHHPQSQLIARYHLRPHQWPHHTTSQTCVCALERRFRVICQCSLIDWECQRESHFQVSRITLSNPYSLIIINLTQTGNSGIDCIKMIWKLKIRDVFILGLVQSENIVFEKPALNAGCSMILEVKAFEQEVSNMIVIE